MAKILQTRAKQHEIADHLYNEMHVHDCSAIPTARQYADGLAAAVILLLDKLGLDFTIDKYDTCNALANHFGVTHYTMSRALAASKVEGKKRINSEKVTYPREKARAALEAYGHIAG